MKWLLTCLVLLFGCSTLSPIYKKVDTHYKGSYVMGSYEWIAADRCLNKHRDCIVFASGPLVLTRLEISKACKDRIKIQHHHNGGMTTIYPPYSLDKPIIYRGFNIDSGPMEYELGYQDYLEIETIGTLIYDSKCVVAWKGYH